MFKQFINNLLKAQSKADITPNPGIENELSANTLFENVDIPPTNSLFEELSDPAMVEDSSPSGIEKNEPRDWNGYKFPYTSLLEDRTANIEEGSNIPYQEKELLLSVLQEFDIDTKNIIATHGPSANFYKITLGRKESINKVKRIKDDIALRLRACGPISIQPILQNDIVGIKVPRKLLDTVHLKSLIEGDLFTSSKMKLPVVIGKTEDNIDCIIDLAEAPNLLIAGSTGQGKSMLVHSIILSLLFKKYPFEIKLLLIDTKRVELDVYNSLNKHFLVKTSGYEYGSVIDDAHSAVTMLRKLSNELDKRLQLFKEARVNKIDDYNDANGENCLPYLIIIIDDFADLKYRTQSDVDTLIAKLAQQARIVGIYLIISTQYPSSEIITSNIKINFNTRIAFKVPEKADSRVILDDTGAERLLRPGNMLLSFNNSMQDIQGCHITYEEVVGVLKLVSDQEQYRSEYSLPEYGYLDEDDWPAIATDLKKRDRLFDECARTVVQMQSASTSNLQRRFNLGYNRAGFIMDQLEAANIVGPALGSRPRQVYFQSEAELDQFLKTLR